MHVWIKGQRVVAELEPELGLGLVIEIHGGRQIEIYFPAAEVKRRYASQGAPLRRFIISAGQKAKIEDGETFVIKSHTEEKGLIRYKGDKVEAWEYEIEHVVHDSTPMAQLLTTHSDSPLAFNLRKKAWGLKASHSDPETKGLLGPRVSLLPHQFYVAREIARREFPRALLADEVGLGKTIEAGLIFSSLRSQGRAERVLILTPESLKHQWLAEMYRRFNEMFAVVDEERSTQEKISQGHTAFEMNQKIICSLDFLTDFPDEFEEATDVEWDLIIVDEAHHLQWAKDVPNPQWEMLKVLSACTKGLLLLTATPENHGMETEFGLLTLVDNERFPDFEKFKKDAKKMHDTAILAGGIFKGDKTPQFTKELAVAFKGQKDLEASLEKYKEKGSPDELLKALIDRHGTGRVLTRNRRSRLKGFPDRKLFTHKITAPKEWKQRLSQIDPEKFTEDQLLRLACGRERVTADPALAHWFKARNKWLAGFLAELKGEKALLICSSAKRAIDIQNALRDESSVRTAIFHEGLEVVERDRQAAWFAEGTGAQVLISSEIGGEGRNFQFVHHLILFDIPLHPDVMEQRVGRLDRIGQKETVKIHVPFFEDTPEEVVIRWFGEGVGSFDEPWNGGDALESYNEKLVASCKSFLPKSKDFEARHKNLTKLLTATQKDVKQIKAHLKESVDILVDLNSFDEKKGNDLVKRIHELESKKDLREFLDQAFDFFGVEVEDLDSQGTQKLVAHSLTFVETYPGLTAQGEQAVTYEREVALKREELAFLNWDHPIAQGTITLILDGNRGKASIGLVPKAQVASPVIELLFVVRTTAPQYLEADFDLPATTIHLLLDLKGRMMKNLSPEQKFTISKCPPNRMEEIVTPLRSILPPIVEEAEKMAKKEAKPLVMNALEKYQKRLELEHNRLVSLSKINPLITKKEIALHKEKIQLGLAAIHNADLQLDAIRVLIPV